MNEENKKIGLSALNIIWCSVGIIFFSSLIILPLMFRAFANEEEGGVSNKPEEVEPQSVAITCTKTDLASSEEYIIHKKNDTIEMLAQEKKYTLVDYNEETPDPCINQISQYQNVNGLYFTCTITDNIVTINSRITFKEFDTSNISPISFNYTQGAKNLQNSLENSGFVCK